MLITKANADSFELDDYVYLFRLKLGEVFTPDGTEGVNVVLLEEGQGIYSVYTRREIGYRMDLGDLLSALEEHADLVA